MPLSINVGLSRKASKDYQSTGTSINIIAELDAALLAKPDELQKQIDGLYREAQDAIDRNTVAPGTRQRAVRSEDLFRPRRERLRERQWRPGPQLFQREPPEQWEWQQQWWRQRA